jgi:hypothetical protein
VSACHGAIGTTSGEPELIHLYVVQRSGPDVVDIEVLLCLLLTVIFMTSQNRGCRYLTVQGWALSSSSCASRRAISGRAKTWLKSTQPEDPALHFDPTTEDGSGEALVTFQQHYPISSPVRISDRIQCFAYMAKNDAFCVPLLVSNYHQNHA